MQPALGRQTHIQVGRQESTEDRLLNRQIFKRPKESRQADGWMQLFLLLNTEVDRWLGRQIFGQADKEEDSTVQQTNSQEGDSDVDRQ